MHTKWILRFALLVLLGGQFYRGNTSCFGAEESTRLDPTIVLTVEGKVQTSTQGAGLWVAAQTNQLLSVGDRVRTGERSRTTLRLSDRSVLRVNELTTLEIRPPAGLGGKSVLDLKSGSSYFFNRERPAEMQFRTPLASGAIRGTEFHLAVDDADGRTVVTLIDGEVQLVGPVSEVTLHPGEEGVVATGLPTSKSASIQTHRTIQWVLYYPAVLNLEDLSWTAESLREIAGSLEAYRRGDILAALAAYPDGRQPATGAEIVYHAALLLAVGQVATAERELDRTQEFPAVQHSLRRLIATVRDPDSGPQAGMAADVSFAPVTATDWLVASYYEQGRNQLESALREAKRATEVSSTFGLAWARRAELEFSFGQTHAAQTSLARGLSLSPRNPEALALRGFLLASENRFDRALSAFAEAIAVDGALGHAWLGQGLCKIRMGQADEGRADLQVAATLEPLRSLWRSYLGKAWHQAGDDVRASKELNLAKRLDPQDPTPWLYSALLAQQQNRVNEAVIDLERSKALNDNRAVYRSRLLLDEDRAVRSANLASVYRDGGMVELSAREAARAVDDDFANYSAHLFLANSYDALRDPREVTLRYETAWFSEQLLANLLGPVDAGALSRNVSQQEYSRLFAVDRVGMSSSTEYTSHGDFLERASHYGTFGKVGYSLDGNYRSERGWRPNNDFESLELSAKIKVQLTPADSVLVHVLSEDRRAGDVAQYYNQTGDPRYGNGPSALLRVREKQDPNLFLGFHHEWSPGMHTLFLGGRLQDRLEVTGSNAPATLILSNGVIVDKSFPAYRGLYQLRNQLEAYSAELEQIVQSPHHTWVVGGRYQHGTIPTHSEFGPTIQDIDPHLDRVSFYAYDFWRILDSLRLIGGVSYDRLEFPANVGLPPLTNAVTREAGVSPKAGFYFTPSSRTTFRGAYTRSLGGAFYDTSVRLEPVQIAGFNQSFRSLMPESLTGQVPGSRFETLGIALDQTVSRGTYFSVEAQLLRAKGTQSFGQYALDNTPPPGTFSDFFDYNTRERFGYTEKTLTVTLNQLVGPNWSLGANYRLSSAQLDAAFIDFAPARQAIDNQSRRATLHQVNLFANFHAANGLFGRAEAIWTQQSNRHFTPDLPGDNFWQYNVYAGWRFARRQSEIRLGLLNLSDRDYRLNPLNLYSELPRGRVFYASLRFYF